MNGNSKDENLPQLDRLITHFEKLYYKEEREDDFAKIKEDNVNSYMTT